MSDEKKTTFEQLNHLGGKGGGEADDETQAEAWREAERRRSTANDPEPPERPGADSPRKRDGV